MGTVLFILFCAIWLVAVLVYLRHMKPAVRERLATKLQALWRWCWLHGQELVGLPAALLVFWCSGIALRWLEPTSAIYDAGVLQGVTVVVVHLLVGNSVARIGTIINLPWYSRQFNEATDRKWLFRTYLGAYCLLAALL